MLRVGGDPDAPGPPEGTTPAIVVSDPNFDEVELIGSVDELTDLAGTVARGEGFVGSEPATPHDGDSLIGVEVGNATRPGVHIRIDSPRRILVIDGHPTARALFADQLHAMSPPWPPRTAVTVTSTTFPGIPISSRAPTPW